MGNLNKLEIWKDSKDLAIKVYAITIRGKFLDDVSMCDQIRKSVVNISSNLVEGEESGTSKEGIRYFSIANVALAELQTQIEIAKEIGYMKARDYLEINDAIMVLSRRLTRLIQYRKKQLDNK